MGFHHRRLVTLLDVGVMASGGGGGEEPPPVLNNAGVWYRADRDVMGATLAAQFSAANLEELTASQTHPALQIGPTTAFTLGGWVWIDATGVVGVAQIAGANCYDDGTRWRFGLTTSAGYGEINMSGAGSHSLGAWHFLIYGFDPTLAGGTQWGRQDNLEEFFGRTTGRGTFTGPVTGNMTLGGGQHTGRMQNWFLFSRYFNDADCAYIYNAGAGRSYEELTPAFKTGLRAWWPLNEGSGSRRDQSGNNVTLTDVNTVTSAAGLIATSPGNGSPVTKWTDSGPNHIDIVNSPFASPGYFTNVRNGKPAIRFNGLNQALSKAGVLGSTFAGVDVSTVFLVFNQLGSDVQSAAYGWLGPSPTNHFNLYTQAGSLGGVAFDVGDATLGVGRMAMTQPSPSADTWHILECYRSGGSGDFTVEGNLAATGTFSGNFIPTNTAQWNVGIDGGSYFGGMDIAELIVFNRALTTPERDSVRNYLKAKWGIAQNKLMLNPSGAGYLLLNPTTNDRLAIN